jgi:hypothetical protein
MFFDKNNPEGVEHEIIFLVQIIKEKDCATVNQSFKFILYFNQDI